MSTNNPNETNPDFILLRAMVRGMYDLQAERIQTGNRLCATFRHKLKTGTEANAVALAEVVSDEADTTNEEADAAAAKAKAKADKEATNFLKMLRDNYKMITEGVLSTRNFAPGSGTEGLISNKAEAALVGVWYNMYEQEQALSKQIAKVVEAFPIYTEWMTHVRGLGPTMGAVILSSVDIYRSRYPSSVWKYAGLDVTADGKGRSRRKADMGTTTYVDPRTGETKEKKTLGYNPFLKTKLMGVLADGMIKANSQYRSVYDDRKTRTVGYNAADPEKFKTPAHRHMDAKRLMIKVFLADLYAVWREMEGLEVHPWYAEEKLGIVHSRPPVGPARQPKAA
jgi:hypothetical protein